jgi:hypothetical protein
MPKHDHDEVPDGAAWFPEIPAELNISGQLLAIIHAVVFIAGSDEKIVHPHAGDEALGMIAEYLDRLTGKERSRILDDLKALRQYAKEQGWPKQLLSFIKDFPKNFGIIGDE